MQRSQAAIENRLTNDTSRRYDEVLMKKIDRRKENRRDADRREVERRIADRFKLPLKGTVVFDIEGKEEKRDLTIRNISAYGAYFVSDLRLEVSDTVTLHLPIGKGEGSFEATATVVRVEDTEDRVGIAVSFEKLPDFG